MKKIAVILMTLLCAGALSAEGIKVSAGADVGFSMDSLKSTASLGTITQSFYTLDVKGFLDFTYAVVSIGYSTQMGVLSSAQVSSYYGNLTTNYDTKMNFLTFSFLAKYPYKMSGVTLFPLLGVEYDMVVNSNTSVISESQAAGYNDFFLVLGGGADLDLSSKVYLRPALTYGFNLTPLPTTSSSSMTYSGGKLRADLALGLRL